MVTQLPSPKGAQPPIFAPYLLRPNGCIDQDVTWYGGRSRSRRLCVRWDSAPPSPKGGPQIFGTCLLRPNGWMDEAGTRHEGRPQPIYDFVLGGDPVPFPQKGAEPSPQFSAHFYCGQTVACIKMPLRIELGLGQGDFVLDGNPAALSPKGAQTPNFWPISVAAKWLHGSRCHLVWS